MKETFKEHIIKDKTILTGTVNFPAPNPFPRDLIAALVLDGVYITDDRKNTDPLDIRHEDYLLQTSKERTALHVYFVEYLQVLKKLFIAPLDSWGNFLMPNEKTNTRNNILYNNHKIKPCLTMIYGAHLKNNIDVVFPDLRHAYTLKNNSFVLFDPDINYYIGKNTSNRPAIIFTTTFADSKNLESNVL
jgi:hypothetical protein|tara:strand:+ start:97 stop:663 length:567 start_codon:yes stop_codon:yes gene_type:complete